MQHRSLQSFMKRHSGRVSRSRSDRRSQRPVVSVPFPGFGVLSALPGVAAKQHRYASFAIKGHSKTVSAGRSLICSKMPALRVHLPGFTYWRELVRSDADHDVAHRIVNHLMIDPGWSAKALEP